MTVEEALQNIRIKYAAYNAANTTRSRREQEWHHYKQVLDKAGEALTVANVDAREALASYQLAKEALIKTIEQEIVCPPPTREAF